jgi:hypothetical protein
VPPCPPVPRSRAGPLAGLCIHRPRRRVAASRRTVVSGVLVLLALVLCLGPATIGEQHLQSADASTTDAAAVAEVPGVAGMAPKPNPATQKRAPCAPGEIEATGFCWAGIDQRPPNCPAYAVEFGGRCIMAVPAPSRTPASVEQGGAHE